MKVFFPYWWYSSLRKNLDTTTTFSDYVIGRFALTKDGKVESKTGKKLSFWLQGPQATLEKSIPADKVLDWLYSLLAVLDTKASALMRLNGVMLATAAFVLRPEYNSLASMKFLVAFSALGSTVSIGCCLLVASVDWRFLGLVKKTNSSEGEELDFAEEFFHLQKVADFRQSCFRLAWVLSFLATIAFLIVIVVFFYHILQFTKL